MCLNHEFWVFVPAPLPFSVSPTVRTASRLPRAARFHSRARGAPLLATVVAAPSAPPSVPAPAPSAAAPEEGKGRGALQAPFPPLAPPSLPKMRKLDQSSIVLSKESTMLPWPGNGACAASSGRSTSNSLGRASAPPAHATRSRVVRCPRHHRAARRAPAPIAAGPNLKKKSMLSMQCHDGV